MMALQRSNAQHPKNCDQPTTRILFMIDSEFQTNSKKRGPAMQLTDVTAPGWLLRRKQCLNVYFSINIKYIFGTKNRSEFKISTPTDAWVTTRYEP